MSTAMKTGRRSGDVLTPRVRNRRIFPIGETFQGEMESTAGNRVWNSDPAAVLPFRYVVSRRPSFVRLVACSRLAVLLHYVASLRTVQTSRLCSLAITEPLVPIRRVELLGLDGRSVVQTSAAGRSWRVYRPHRGWISTDDGRQLAASDCDGSELIRGRPVDRRRPRSDFKGSADRRRFGQLPSRDKDRRIGLQGVGTTLAIFPQGTDERPVHGSYL